LFSGIGGFSLAAKWCWGKELEIVGFVENDKHCQRVLKKHWSDVLIHSDIKNYKYNGTVDLITGGFPCQDINIAGKGVGIEGERSGLWTEFKRIISEVRPKFALIENVPILTNRGLDRVLCNLAEIGYDAEWQCISASEVGAWHKRERIWIVAYPTNSRTKRMYKRENLSHKRQWEFEPELGRVAHGIPSRVDRLRCLGNAVVPQQIYPILQAIADIERQDEREI